MVKTSKNDTKIVAKNPANDDIDYNFLKTEEELWREAVMKDLVLLKQSDLRLSRFVCVGFILVTCLQAFWVMSLGVGE